MHHPKPLHEQLKDTPSTPHVLEIDRVFAGVAGAFRHAFIFPIVPRALHFLADSGVRRTRSRPE